MNGAQDVAGDGAGDVVSDGAGDPRERARALADAFDRSFAEAAREAAEAPDHLLGVRVAGEPYAIRLGEVRGLLARQRIVPVPSPLPEMLGIIGRRGGIVPVYSLRAFVVGAGAAAATTTAPERTAWVLLTPVDVVPADGGAAGIAPAGPRAVERSLIGLAFDAFDGTLRVAPADVTPAAGGAARAHIAEVVRAGGALRGVVSLRSIVQVVQQRAGAASSAAAGDDKER